MKLITPKDKKDWLEMRAQDVTSTECAALFGLSPYQSKFELWTRKKSNNYVSFEPSERMNWGNRLEHAIAWGIAEDNDWIVEPMKDYGRSEEMKAGSSFDFKITQIKDSMGAKEPVEGLLEIKNVDGLIFRDQWDMDTGEAPAHIELQVQHQLMITGYKFAYIGALVGGNELKLIKRVPDPEIIAQIKAKIRQFWDSIEKNEAPLIDFKADAAFIKELYSKAEEGKEIEGTDKMLELALKYKQAGEEEKQARIKKDACKAEMLMEIDDASKVKGEKFSISAGMTKEVEVSFTRKAFRNFRVTIKKEKTV